VNVDAEPVVSDRRAPNAHTGVNPHVGAVFGALVEQGGPFQRCLGATWDWKARGLPEFRNRRRHGSLVLPEPERC
jgi:hypothetical protein